MPDHGLTWPATPATRNDGSTAALEQALQRQQLKLEALLASRTADLRATEARIAHFSRLMSTLSAINRALLVSTSLDEVFATACRACVTLGGYRLAWIGLLDISGSEITIKQRYGPEVGFLANLKIEARAEPADGLLPSAVALREQRLYHCADLFSDPAAAAWQARAKRHGLRACVALPISAAGQPGGVLTVYAETGEAYDQSANRVLEEIGKALSFAIVHFADLAERQRTADALQDSEALLQEAQKVAALGHWTYVVETGRINWSAQLYRLFEYDPTLAITRLDTLIERYLPDSARLLHQALAKVISGGERRELELQLELSGRRRAYHALAVIPRRNAQGKTLSLYGTIQDITEHKQNEAKLLHLAEQLVEAANEAADLYEHAPCGYHSLDAEGIFRMVNHTELQRLGYLHEELVGQKNLRQLLTPTALRTFDAIWPNFLAGGTVHDLELEFIRKDGTTLPVLLSATAIRDANGVFQMSRATVYDMTERRRMEQERAEHARRMTELSRHLVAVQEGARRHLSGELHDRTSPNLAAIDINFSMVARELPAASFPTLAARLDDIRALIKDTSTSIHEICADLRPPLLDYAGLPAALDAYAARFTNRTGIEVRTSYAEPLKRLAPDIESMFFRIAQESLTNCAKHAQATKIELRLDNDRSPNILSIADNGHGFIPASLASKVGDGGLGILNMREMAEFAGGKFSIESTPGQGTRIRVEIP